MVFPQSGSLVGRHPSQLYEFFLEGVVLFVILWVSSRKKTSVGITSGLFLVFYGLFRFVIEFMREPDAHLGILSSGLSMGQWLCVPMLFIGLFLLLRGKKLE